MTRSLHQSLLALAVVGSVSCNFDGGLALCQTQGRCPSLDGGAALDGGTATGGGTATDGGTPGEQFVLRTSTFHTETETRTLASTFPVPPVLLVRSGQTWTIASGHLVDAGVYGFVDIPEGERYLLYDGRYFVNPATTVDLSAHLAGRPGVAVTDGGTFLNLTMTGAAAYPFALELVDLTAGVYGSNYEFGLASAPLQEGDVPMLLSFDHRQALGVPLAPLPDTSKGDLVRLTMLNRELLYTEGGLLIQYSLTTSANLDPLVMVDHSSTAATATFEVKGVAQSVSLDWRRSDFWALATAVHPQPQFDSLDMLYTKAMPGVSTEGYFTDAPNLFYLLGLGRSVGDKSNVGLDAGFTNPYPPSWSTVVYAFQCFFAPEVVVVPGNAEDAGIAVTPTGCIQRVELASSIEGQPIRPVLSPPKTFLVDGTSPYQSHALSSLTPTVSWGPPAQGVPSQYNLSLSRVLVEASSSRLQTVAVISTAGTSIVVPPGVLESGQRYVFQLEAYNNPACSSAAPYPYRRAFPEHSAQTTSSVLRAP